VSQCHDVYEPNDFPPADAGPELSGTRRHGCHFVSETHDKVRVVRVVGSLDWTNEVEFTELIGQGDEPVLIIDLTAGRVDAAGTGALVLATEQARDRGRQLVLVATDPVQLSVMISTGLNIVVPVVSSKEEAVTWCERHGIPHPDRWRVEVDWRSDALGR
jgi:anti-anti-sigma factor